MKFAISPETPSALLIVSGTNKSTFFDASHSSDISHITRPLAKKRRKNSAELISIDLKKSANGFLKENRRFP